MLLYQTFTEFFFYSYLENNIKADLMSVGFWKEDYIDNDIQLLKFVKAEFMNTAYSNTKIV